jgi:hypothetical protein
MISLTKFGLTLAVVALTSIVAISIPAVVSAQNMTGNMTGGQNTTADINQTGSISSYGSGCRMIDGNWECEDLPPFYPP